MHHEDRLDESVRLRLHPVRVLRDRPHRTVDRQVGGNGPMAPLAQDGRQPVVPTRGLRAAVHEQKVHAWQPLRTPVWTPASFAQGLRRTRPLGIGEHDERVDLGVPDVGPGRAQRQHPLILGVDVVGPQVRVVALLALLRPGARLQPHGQPVAAGRQQMRVAVPVGIDLVPEHLRPELRHPPDVLHVERSLRESASHR
jgi:hypothetical protein